MAEEVMPDIKKYFPTIDEDSLQAFNIVYEIYKNCFSISEKMYETNIPLISISVSKRQKKENEIIKDVIEFCQLYEINQPIQSSKKTASSYDAENKIAEKNAKVFNRYLLSYIDSLMMNGMSDKTLPNIKKIFPLISKEDVKAFKIVYDFYVMLTKRNAVIQKILFQKEDCCIVNKSESDFEAINKILLFCSELFISRHLILLSYEDKIKFQENIKIFDSAYRSHLHSLMIKPFWKAEYIKRNHYWNLIKNGIKDIEESKAFNILSEWRKKREDRIRLKKRPPDCELPDCYFRKEKSIAMINLRPPFFYNFNCKPSFQDSLDTNDYCAFKTDILFSILMFHNVKFPGFLTKISDPRLSNPFFFTFYDSNTQSWSSEFNQNIEELHRITFETGLLVFDLFGVTSPEKLLKDSCNNKAEISDEIIKLPVPEFFLKADPGEQDYGQGFSDKLYDPINMAVVKRDPEKKAIDITFLEQRFKGFEFVIGIEGDITNNDFSIKKEVLRIRKALEEYDSSNNNVFNPLNHQEQFIVFAFNPSESSFNIKKCIEDVRLIINSYRSALVPFAVQIDEFQEELFNIDQKIQYVKSYQESDRTRTIGLYIWDQVHFLNKPINEIIHEFIDSEFYEKVMKLSNAEIKQRKDSASAANKIGSLGSQKEYDEVYRNYEYASCCIKQAELLTGAECERIISNETQKNKS